MNSSWPSRLNAATRSAAVSISKLDNWRRCLAAFAAGAVSALAFAPFYLLPLFAIGISALIVLLDGGLERPRRFRLAFLDGWFFGFGYFLVGVYWMAFSFFVQADEFAWMAPFAVLGVPAFLALFTGGAALVSAVLWRKSWARIGIFAVVFMLFEYARGHVLTGLPWNLPGQVLAGTAMGSQTAAWVGAYGLSLAVVVLAGAPAAFIYDRRPLAGFAVSVAGALVIFALGAGRLAAPDAPDAPDTFVRIIQPNIPQREKIDPALWGRNFSHHIDLSTGETRGQTFVIWPENAAALVGETPAALQAISDAFAEDATLITGAVRRDRGADGRTRYYNSIAIIPETSRGRIAAAHYDKHHLVAFGEYLPMQDFLRLIGLAQLAPYDDGFTAGAGPTTIKMNGSAFAPLICFEAIFPGEMYPRDQRPDWLVTVTNDAWFGDTSGPRQHLDQSRLRAVETGLPMARAANTGISALIDSKGRLLSRVPLYEQGRIDAPLPGALPPTLYSKTGDLGFLILALVVLGVSFWAPGHARASD